MKKKVCLALSAVMMLSFLAGCGGGTSSSAAASEASNAQGSSTSSESKTEDTGKKQVVVYSNTDQDGADGMVAAGKEIGIDVTVVMLSGGGEVIDRLIAEKNAPSADVVYGVNHIGFARLKAQDLLTPFTPDWAADVADGLKDPDGYYYGVGMSAILLAYNPEVAKPAPTDWPDLWTKSEFKGKYFVDPKTTGGTTQLVLSGILSRYRDDAGELGISAEGWQAVTEYYKNAYIKQEGDDFFALLAEGKVVAGQNYSLGVIKAQGTYEKEFAWAKPDVGVPFAVEMVGIVNGCKNPDAAQEFLNYYGSKDVMLKVSKSVPTIKEARGNIPAELTELIDSVKVQEIDYDFVAKNLDKWLEKIELEIIP